MKFVFITTLLMSFVSMASADLKQLDQGDYALVPIAASNVDVHLQRIPCGPACTAANTVVTLLYTFSGCLDRVISLHHVEEDGDQATIYVTALNVLTEKSKGVRCFVAPTQLETITLNNIYSAEDVDVVFVGVQ